MVKPGKSGHLHLVYHFTIPLCVTFEWTPSAKGLIPGKEGGTLI